MKKIDVHIRTNISEKRFLFFHLNYSIKIHNKICFDLWDNIDEKIINNMGAVQDNLIINYEKYLV